MDVTFQELALLIVSQLKGTANSSTSKMSAESFRWSGKSWTKTMGKCHMNAWMETHGDNVHKTLISASKVHSDGHVVVVDSNGGHIIPYISTLARKIQQFVPNETVNEPGARHLYLDNGTYPCGGNHHRQKNI